MKPNPSWTLLFAFVAFLSSQASIAQSVSRIEIEMDATRIRSNLELPKLLYIVPWKDTELSDSLEDRKIIIPDLFADYYQPLKPDETSVEHAQNE